MKKKELTKFNIDISALSNREHVYQFEISDELFRLFGQDIVSSGSGACTLTLTKSETMMSLHFDIDAMVALTCDVSLRPYDHIIKIKKHILVKFGEEDDELSDEVIVLSHDTPTVNVADFLYQFLLLEIPMKKIHPELVNEARPDMAYRDTAEAREADPRWAALKKLK